MINRQELCVQERESCSRISHREKSGLVCHQVRFSLDSNVLRVNNKASFFFFLCPVLRFSFSFFQVTFSTPREGWGREICRVFKIRHSNITPDIKTSTSEYQRCHRTTVWCWRYSISLPPARGNYNQTKKGNKVDRSTCLFQRELCAIHSVCFYVCFFSRKILHCLKDIWINSVQYGTTIVSGMTVYPHGIFPTWDQTKSQRLKKCVCCWLGLDRSIRQYD